MNEIPEAEINRMREDFNKELENYYSSRQCKPEWDKKRIAEVIEKIEQPSIEKCPKNYYYHNRYKVTIIDGQKILASKKSNQPNKLIKIVPTEEYFEILLEAHLASGHGGRDKMVSYLKETAYVPSTVAALFPKHCKICKCKRVVKRPRATNVGDYKRGFLHIVNMVKTPCECYNYIMYYKDLHTNFSFLRALTDDSYDEITLELTKIFLELGGPAILYSTRDHIFTKTIVDNLCKECPDFVMLIGNTVDPKEKDECDFRIRTKVANWMTERKSKRWSIGIYFIQFALNNTLDEEQDGTPYKAMFGIPPKMGIDTTDIPLDVAKKLKDESDLIEWRFSNVVKRYRRRNNNSQNICNNIEEQTSAPEVGECNNIEQKSAPETRECKNIEQKSAPETGECNNIEQKSAPETGECNNIEQKSAPETRDSAAVEDETIPERVWCWVCEQDDDAVTFLCNSCKGPIHKTCGKFNDDSQTNIDCNLCLSESKQRMGADVMVCIKEEPSEIEVKCETITGVSSTVVSVSVVRETDSPI